MSLIETSNEVPQLEELPSRNVIDQLSFKQRTELVAWAEAKLQDCVQPRIAFEQQWYMNMAFYFGKHYVAWVNSSSGTLSRLYEPPAPPYRVRSVVNKCRRIVRTELTKITRQFPQYYVVPNSTSETDRIASQAAEQIAEYLIREHQWNDKFRRASHWTTICGTGFLKIYWDGEKVDPSGVMGAMCLDPISPFHVFIPNIQDQDIEEQPYVIHTTLQDASEVNLKWNSELEPNIEVSGGALEQRFFNALGIRSNAPTKNKVQVYEMWVKPCSKFPEGTLILWANKQLLQVLDSWPYTRSEYPFAKLDHIPTGRFYGDSSLVDLIPLQKELNRTHSQIIESKNKMAKPQWKAQRGSVDVNKMTSEPGLVILYTPGFQPPEPVQPPSMPTYVIDELERLAREMDDLAATGEITKGNVPPGVTAASAISYLQEENDNRFAPTVASLEAATEKLGKYMLSFVAEYWDEERQVKVIGDGRILDAQVFSKSDVRGNTDFVVETGSAAPRSRAAKQAFILELVKMGMIESVQALKYLEMVETNKFYEDAQLDARQIAREHVMFREADPMMIQQQVMMQQQMMPQMNPMGMESPPEVDPMTGQPQMQPQMPEIVPVNEWDDDMAHDVGHANWFKTPEFTALDPVIQQIAVAHWHQHKQRAMEKAMQMAQQQQMLNPSPVGENGSGPISQRQAPNNPERQQQ